MATMKNFKIAVADGGGGCSILVEWKEVEGASGAPADVR